MGGHREAPQEPGGSPTLTTSSAPNVCRFSSHPHAASIPLASGPLTLSSAPSGTSFHFQPENFQQHVPVPVPPSAPRLSVLLIQIFRESQIFLLESEIPVSGLQITFPRTVEHCQKCRALVQGLALLCDTGCFVQPSCSPWGFVALGCSPTPSWLLVQPLQGPLPFGPQFPKALFVCCLSSPVSLPLLQRH